MWIVLGSPKEPGILLRVLEATFQHIREHQYEAMDVKPYLRNDAQFLNSDQVKQEKSIKAAVFASCKAVRRNDLRHLQLIQKSCATQTQI